MALLELRVAWGDDTSVRVPVGQRGCGGAPNRVTFAALKVDRRDAKLAAVSIDSLLEGMGFQPPVRFQGGRRRNSKAHCQFESPPPTNESVKTVRPIRVFCSGTPTLSRDPPSERRSPISHCPTRTGRNQPTISSNIDKWSISKCNGTFSFPVLSSARLRSSMSIPAAYQRIGWPCSSRSAL